MTSPGATTGDTPTNEADPKRTPLRWAQVLVPDAEYRRHASDVVRVLVATFLVATFALITRYDTVVISFEGVDFVDSQGSAKIDQLIELADSYGAELRLARVKQAVVDLLERDGVIERLGPDNIYDNVYEACVDHITQEHPEVGLTPDGRGS